MSKRQNPKKARGVLVTVEHEIRDVEIPIVGINDEMYEQPGGLYEQLGCDVVDEVTLATDPTVVMWGHDGPSRQDARPNPIASAIAGYYLTHPKYGNHTIDHRELPQYEGNVVFLGDDGTDIADLPGSFALARQAAEAVAAGLRGEIRTAR